MFNKNYYLLAREGDTFKSIGKEVGISWRKLARYNERDKKDVLHEGDIIFLKKKRSKAPKTFKNVPHVVKPGESMYLISQRYGIKLKSLYKMNNLSPTYQIYPGAKLKVR
jgi:LysM repeat protein